MVAAICAGGTGRAVAAVLGSRLRGTARAERLRRCGRGSIGGARLGAGVKVVAGVERATDVEVVADAGVVAGIGTAAGTTLAGKRGAGKLDAACRSRLRTIMGAGGNLSVGELASQLADQRHGRRTWQGPQLTCARA